MGLAQGGRRRLAGCATTSLWESATGPPGRPGRRRSNRPGISQAQGTADRLAPLESSSRQPVGAHRRGKPRPPGPVKLSGPPDRGGTTTNRGGPVPETLRRTCLYDLHLANRRSPGRLRRLRDARPLRTGPRGRAHLVPNPGSAVRRQPHGCGPPGWPRRGPSARNPGAGRDRQPRRCGACATRCSPTTTAASSTT